METSEGLCEGCSISPILFNVYYQAVMRQAEACRRARSGDVNFARCEPDGLFAEAKAWERGGRERKTGRMSWGWFADDTTIVGMKLRQTYQFARPKMQ